MESVYNRERGIYGLKFIVSVTPYMICLNSKSHLLPADGDRKNQSYIKSDTHKNHFQPSSPFSGTLRAINPGKTKPLSWDMAATSQTNCGNRS